MSFFCLRAFLPEVFTFFDLVVGCDGSAAALKRVKSKQQSGVLCCVELSERRKSDRRVAFSRMNAPSTRRRSLRSAAGKKSQQLEPKQEEKEPVAMVTTRKRRGALKVGLWSVHGGKKSPLSALLETRWTSSSDFYFFC